MFAGKARAYPYCRHLKGASLGSALDSLANIELVCKWTNTPAKGWLLACLQIRLQTRMEICMTVTNSRAYHATELIMKQKSFIALAPALAVAKLFHW